MITYEIKLPLGYPRQKKLEKHLKSLTHETDTLVFTESEGVDVPECHAVITHPNLVLTNPATGERFGLNGNRVNDAIRDFERHNS